MAKFTRVGCYMLDLYCSLTTCDHAMGNWRGPIHYTGRTKSECLREAKADGWLLRGNGRDICPDQALVYKRRRFSPSEQLQAEQKKGG